MSGARDKIIDQFVDWVIEEGATSPDASREVLRHMVEFLLSAGDLPHLASKIAASEKQVTT